VATKQAIRARIEEVGIIPSIRTRSADDARFAAETVHEAGIGVVEVAMTVPDALKVITDLVERRRDLIVGADSAWDLESARRAVDAGAMFVTSPGLDSRAIMEFVDDKEIVVIPGALTPSEVGAAWQAGADFVKVFPCESVGGPRYLKALRRPLPNIPIIAAGGVNQVTAAEYIRAGALAIGVSSSLIPEEAVERWNGDWIAELARRFLSIVKAARAEAAISHGPSGPSSRRSRP
jgi:2-dehydro-3-deoxyphosphogluconate aldolase/(4S)-4-hydroxy-2-oxoglutarate aldolase